MTDLIIGRFQPLHDGHIALIESSLNKGNKVVIGIRNTKTDEDNPYSVDERISMIESVFGKRVDTIEIPDPGCELTVIVGRKVGYDVRRMPEPLERVSGTAIRSNIEKYPDYCFRFSKQQS